MGAKARINSHFSFRYDEAEGVFSRLDTKREHDLLFLTNHATPRGDGVGAQSTRGRRKRPLAYGF